MKQTHEVAAMGGVTVRAIRFRAVALGIAPKQIGRAFWWTPAQARRLALQRKAGRRPGKKPSA